MEEQNKTKQKTKENTKQNTKQNAKQNTKQNAKQNQHTLNPMLFVFIFLLIVAYILLFASLGESDNSGSNAGRNILGFVVVIILLIIILAYLVEYFMDVNLFEFLYNLANGIKQPIVSNQQQLENVIEDILLKKQVFNVADNKYTYEDAKAICKAYESRLATYDEVENSYNNGGEWCKYGWSEGQMALFPTQESTYNKLQTIKGHEHDCGRPGVNGGYIENANAQFGVNCYGKKPKIQPTEAQMMENASPIPVTNEQIEFQKKVDYWKTKIDGIVLSPFNSKNWSA